MSDSLIGYIQYSHIYPYSGISRVKHMYEVRLQSSLNVHKCIDTCIVSTASICHDHSRVSNDMSFCHVFVRHNR